MRFGWAEQRWVVYFFLWVESACFVREGALFCPGLAKSSIRRVEEMWVWAGVELERLSLGSIR